MTPAHSLEEAQTNEPSTDSGKFGDILFAELWPLTFLRIRFPSASKPSETTPRQRPGQVL